MANGTSRHLATVEASKVLPEPSKKISNIII